MPGKFQSTAERVQGIGEVVEEDSIDELGNHFVNSGWRSGKAVVINTPLAYPCDALCLSAASNLVVQMTEDPSSETVPLSLPAGISRVGVQNVVSASGTPTITALYIRRPPEEA